MIFKKMETKTIKLNPKIYPLEIIYSAAYVFLEKAYIKLDGDIDKEIIVEIKSKDNEIKNIELEFQNELLNYAEYNTNLKNNKEIRQAIIQRALMTNDETIIDEIFEEIDDEEIDDPEGIAIPWEEKYGKEFESKKNDN